MSMSEAANRSSEPELVEFHDDLVRHRYAKLEQVRLHYVEAGPDDGPLVVLLHGFPEFWYSWRHQLAVLPAHGYRVVAPDLRGYNRSDKPSGVRNYAVETLAADVEQLIDALGADRATIVGHDWGGFVAWWFAMLHPSRLERLCVMNCPHPGHALTMMSDPAQLRRSWYMMMFQVPRLPERRLRANDFAAMRKLFRTDPERPGAFSESDIDRYVDALGGASGQAAINYYRAFLRRNPFAVRKLLRPIDAPTQIIWGAKDKHLGLEYAEPPAKWVWDVRVALIEDASHWVQVDAPQRVNELLLDFLPDPTEGK
jgi:pimeloyl-ACP methyl ester carboxylesterase